MHKIFLFSCLILLGPVMVAGQKIALTFDDAPTPDSVMFSGEERSRRILEHLERHGVAQAAFFVVTSNVNIHSIRRIRRYAEAGHAIANHTHRHQWMHRIGLRDYAADIAKADSILRPMPGFRPWFRYPFLDEGRTREARDTIRAVLNALGLSNGYVTVDTYDWYINELLREAVANGRPVNEEKLKRFYIEHIWNSIRFYDDIAHTILGRSPSHVLLLHENDLAARFLGDLIQFLKSNGCEIITVDEAYCDPIASRLPDVLFDGQGRIGAIAREKGMEPRELVQESEDENYLDREAQLLGIFGR